MLIILLADYRGVLTNERYYTAGQHDIDDDTAAALVAAGRAEYVTPPEPEPVAKTKTTKRSARP